MLNLCFFNGRILPFSEAKISINDLGLLRAYAVFDYLRTYQGIPYRLPDYLNRFRNSAKLTGLKLQYSDAEITKQIYRLLAGQNTDKGIRLLLTGGYANDSISPVKPNFFILIEKIPPFPEKIFTNGVKLITCDFVRFMPLAKTTHYVNSIRLGPEKERAKAFDILYHLKGKISESSRNNIFILKKKILLTPKENILHGITRKAVLELAEKNIKALKIENIEEKNILLEDLRDAEEAFITGSSKGIIPVTRVDKLTIGNNKPGRVTKMLMNFFDAETRKKSGRY